MPRPTKKPNRAGRPPRAGKASTEIVKLRVTPDERRAWEQAAEREDKTLSEWIRERCNR
ncbi:MAG TPA: hypothetical protein VF183_12405 [Acidimicrobiales bacterium]